MKINGWVALILIIGYIFNMHNIAVDTKERPYDFFAGAGVIIIPLGSILGGVYALEIYNLVPKQKGE